MNVNKTHYIDCKVWGVRIDTSGDVTKAILDASGTTEIRTRYLLLTTPESGELDRSATSLVSDQLTPLYTT